MLQNCQLVAIADGYNSLTETWLQDLKEGRLQSPERIPQTIFP
jgi:hypothetical protein